MSGIKVDTSAVATMLKNAAAGLNQDAAGELAAKIVKEDVKGHFDAGGRPTRWAAPKWRSGSPLVNTGLLRNSIFHGKEGNGWRVFTNDVRAGTLHYGAKQGAFGRYYQLFRLKYAKNDFRRYAGMKKGHPIPWNDIPARPIMVLRPEAVEKILAALKRRTEGGG